MPPFDLSFVSKSARFWSTIVIQALLIALVLFAVSWLWISVSRAARTQPPVEITPLDPKDLGQLCPGDLMEIHNRVIIKESTILVYYISIMDATGSFNIPGTQEVLPGFPHPYPATFEQAIPWKVPFLEDGLYLRSFSARGTDGTEKAVFVESLFQTKGDECNE